jgi:hypothetical protein
MVLLIFLFGPCTINAVSRFISNKSNGPNSSSLSRNTHLCLHPVLSGDTYRLHWSTTETSTTSSTLPCCPIVSRNQQDESLPLFPTAVGCLSQTGHLLGLET